MKIEVTQDYYKTKILINGLPHVCIETDQFVGFNSSMDSDTKCYIEFITKTNIFTTEYDSVDKWKAVLKELNDSL